MSNISHEQAAEVGTSSDRTPKGIVHLSLQGKGGVGKSLVGSIVAQYYAHRGAEVQCIDTDPVNQTLSQYRALKAKHLKLLTSGNVDQRGFMH